MQFKKQEIEKVLSSIKSNLASKNLDSQFSHIFFTEQNILSFNGKIIINYPYKTGMNFSVDGQKLFSIISRMPGENIILTMKDDSLSIKGELKAEASLKITKDISVLEQADFLNKKFLKWNPIPEEFNEGINLCRFSITKDYSKPALSCIYINEDKIFSSDNFRISKWEMKKSINNSFLIPGNLANILSGFKISYYLIKSHWLHFKTEDNVIISSLSISDEFPDVEDFFNIKGSILSFPEESKDIIQDISVILEENFKQDEFIQVLFDKNESLIYFIGESYLGTFKKCLYMKDKEKIKKDFSLKINPNFLIAILNKGTQITVDNKSPRALFKRDNFSHVISLIG